jgi:hypothetical protein
MRTVTIYLLLALSLVGSRGSAELNGEELVDNQATLDELELLSAKKSWNEVLFRANQVRPGERGSAWQRLVESAAVHHLEWIIESGITGADQIAVDLQSSYPFLVRSPEFLRQRAQASLSAAVRCYTIIGRKAECTARIVDLVNHAKDDPELVVVAAEEVSRRDSALAALPLYLLALERTVGPRHGQICALPEVKAAIRAGAKGRGPAAARLSDECGVATTPSPAPAPRDSGRRSSSP